MIERFLRLRCFFALEIHLRVYLRFADLLLQDIELQVLLFELSEMCSFIDLTATAIDLSACPCTVIALHHSCICYFSLKYTSSVATLKKITTLLDLFDGS